MSNGFSLPEERKPRVLDKQMVWQAVKNAAQDAAADPDQAQERLNQVSVEDQKYLIATTKTIRLEFLQILKIDNLSPLTSLTRLYLDNNFIEKVTGLDALAHLVWLDLSFNRIIKIEGLEALKKLQVLSLYSNQIQVIENLHHLSQLCVLRLGMNQLSSRDDIIYLRKLKSLRTLSLRGNPWCDEDPDWMSYVKALLPHLTYLEHHAVSQAEREGVLIKYQGDIYRAEGREEEEDAANEKRRKQIESEQRYRAAFVDTIQGDYLLKNMFSRPSSKSVEQELAAKLFTEKGALSLREQFEHDLVELGNKIHELGLRQLTVRESEIKAFEESLEVARVAAQRQGIEAVEAYLLEKGRIFNRFYYLASEIEDTEPEVTGSQNDAERHALSDELGKLLEEFVHLTRNVWDQVMCQEMTLVTQIEDMLECFVRVLYSQIEHFLDEAKVLFQRGRMIDTKYFKSLSIIGLGLDLSNQPTGECGENVLSLIAQSHDAHQDHLLEEEARLRESVNEWASNYLEDFRIKERIRHRARVLELNHFLDCMKSEEEELESIIPDQQQCAAKD